MKGKIIRPEHPGLIVCKNLINLCWSEPPQADLQKVLRDIVKGDKVTNIANSRNYIAQLYETAWSESRHGHSTQDRMLQAQMKDQEVVRTLLRGVVVSPTDKDAVMSLEKELKERLMVELMDLTNHLIPIDEANTMHYTERLIIKLSLACGILPSELVIHGHHCSNAKLVCQGGFGNIYQAMLEGNMVAMKVVGIGANQDPEALMRIRRRFCREALMWKSLKYKHILPFLGLNPHQSPPFYAMVSPWMQNGSLMQYLADMGQSAVLNRDVNQFLRQIAKGVEYLHRKRVVHGDLRGANILIDESRSVRITDFGLTVFADSVTGLVTGTSGYGSSQWMAPELLDHTRMGLATGQRTFASDVYAFACVCVEVYTERSPFRGQPRGFDLKEAVLNGIRPQRPSFPRAMSDPLWDIVNSCWLPNSLARPSIGWVVGALKPMQ